jgi:hypothetical protein
MKKLVFFILLSFAVFPFPYLAFHHWKHQKNQFLSKETYLKNLNKSILLNKLKMSPPSWMREQILEDFQDYQEKSISSKNITSTFQQIQKTLGPNSQFVRYRVFRNELYRYFPENEPISLKDNSTEKALKTILVSTSLPDLDFIISFNDGIWPHDQYYLTKNIEEQAPLLVSAKIIGMHHTILIPDWRSIGAWWIADSKAILAKKDLVSWEKKKEMAIWRGGLTNPHRQDLCQLSFQFPDYLDARISLGETRPVDQKFIGNRLSWEELMRYKYLPYMDGVMCASPALQWRLLSGSLTFKPDSSEIQWFYRALRPFVHYVPIKADLSDLIEKLEWAKTHDAECKQIASQASQFALGNLLYPEVLFYFYQVLQTYASLQISTPSETETELLTDARWVSIQKRAVLKKEAKQLQMHGYTNKSTPF